MHYGNFFFGHSLVGAAYMGASGVPPFFGAIPAAVFTIIIILAAAWTLIWKGIALWRAARNRQTAWYVVMLIVNTLGILEIVYLLFFRADKKAPVVTTDQKVAVAMETAPTDPSSLPDLKGPQSENKEG